jgi:hypothetical protein
MTAAMMILLSADHLHRQQLIIMAQQQDLLSLLTTSLK